MKMNAAAALVLLVSAVATPPAEARLSDLQNAAQIEAEKQVIRSPHENIKTCWGWSCAVSESVVLSETDWKAIDAHFSPAPADPQKERLAIQRAIGTMETIIGELNGVTKNDLGAPNRRGQGQTDCVDESTNTTRYLKFLIARGLISFHEVTDIEFRFNNPFNPFLGGQHFTATLKDRKTGQRFAVDSWWYDNGVPPGIQELKKWLSREGFDLNRVP